MSHPVLSLDDLVKCVELKAQKWNPTLPRGPHTETRESHVSGSFGEKFMLMKTGRHTEA